MTTITVLICTHNRAELLARTIDYLSQAKRPRDAAVEILVVANACTDDTHTVLERLQRSERHADGLPLRWIAEPAPGKSRAINRAVPEVRSDLVAFVDDDHRVEANYLAAIAEAGRRYPEADLFCGRIHPDWDGTEPEWVHDTGPYRIYPLPVPRYDGGAETHLITAQTGGIPGGGNLVVRREMLEAVGPFSTELGPHGHDLGGGEDSEWVRRALRRGAVIRYIPDIVQHHYVDVERLSLPYLLRKSYQRTRSGARVRYWPPRVPLYMWRKLMGYGLESFVALSWRRRRFFMVRTAAALGEIRGARESAHGARRSAQELPTDSAHRWLAVLSVFTAFAGLLALALGADGLRKGTFPVLASAAVLALTLTVKSAIDFSQTGPTMRNEVLRHYRRSSVFSLVRLAAWAFVISVVAACAGVVLYSAAASIRGTDPSVAGLWLAAAIGILAVSGGQAARKLVLNPGLLVASMHYRSSRLYSVSALLTARRLAVAQWTIASLAAATVLAGAASLLGRGEAQEALSLLAAAAFFAGLIAVAAWRPEPVARRRPRSAGGPNILMIGSDTLRADRLGAVRYHRKLTPNIDRLAERGTLFTHCYVPCARTAPSLVSLLTGTWPHTHGIRDNFVAAEDALLGVPALPQALREHGYRTAAISDWCGADMGKFTFGFELTDLPEDQWNLGYLMRQGPKDLRLFVSLFMHNRLGRHLVPEIYYLGGVPLTSTLGVEARRLVSRLGAQSQPFLLNVFYSTTHPPFASEHPYYLSFADPGYSGESKFAMARLTDPFDIIRRQGDSRKEFDLDQIIDLYDGCVSQFDAEVGRMLAHIERCGLAEETIVVVYSDHGMEFFEHDTWGQGNSVFGDASARVPLLIVDPRRPGRGPVSDVVRSIDLAPTLYELTGTPTPASLDGESLVPVLEGDAPRTDRVVFNETGVWVTDLPGTPPGHLRYPDLPDLLDVPDYATGTLAVKPEYAHAVVRAKDRMVRLGRWKLTYQPMQSGEIVQLFDVAEDPECRRDVRASHPEIAARLTALLDEWLRVDGIERPLATPRYVAA